MSARNDGGPAFPREDYQTDSANGQSGMTLRDYFAAKALDASIAAGHDIVMRGHEGWRDELAREAYRYADSMILAREATP